MIRSKHGIVLTSALVLSMLILLAGCSSQPATADDSAFWTPLRVRGLEANPAKDLADLVDRSPLIFTGKVLSVEEGPTIHSEGEGEDIVPAALVVRTNEVIKGQLDSKDVKIITMTSWEGLQSLPSKAKPSGNQAIFFLEATIDGYYACTAAAGLVEDTPDGLVSVMDPVYSVLFNDANGNKQSFIDLVKQVKKLVK